MHPVVAVIFDMDGVLVDSADAHRRAWQQLGHEVGTPFTDELFRQTFGQRNASIIPAWLGASAAVDVEALAARKESLYRALVRHGAVRVYPGALALLQRLRALGTRLAVASSGPRENVSLLVDIIGARDDVAVIVASEDVSAGKPHPEGFLKAAERLAVPVDRCAVVEDSVHGIEAAARAHMLAVAVLTSTARAALLAAGAAVIVDDVSQLEAVALITRLAARRAR